MEDGSVEAERLDPALGPRITLEEEASNSGVVQEDSTSESEGDSISVRSDPTRSD